jgi:hypothetical protein
MCQILKASNESNRSTFQTDENQLVNDASYLIKHPPIGCQFLTPRTWRDLIILKAMR